VRLLLLISGCIESGGTIEVGDPTEGDSEADHDPGLPPDDSTGDGDPQATDLGWRLHDEIRSLIYATWQQSADVEGYVEYSFEDDVWLQTPARTFKAGAEEQILLGVPYETDVSFRVVLAKSPMPEATGGVVGRTGDLPEGLPPLELVAADASLWEPSGRYLMGSVNQDTGGWSGGDYWKFIVDRQGRYLWAHLTPMGHWTLYFQPSWDGGDLLWDEATYWADYDQGAGSLVYRMKIDGTILDTYVTPGLHHAFLELADGALIWGAASGRGETLEQLMPDGAQTTLWDCGTYLESIGSRSSCQSNSLFWQQETDTILYSFYTFESVLELERGTGNVVHRWGHLDGSWIFDPEESAFWWQHGASYTDEGTLLTSTHVGSRDQETAVREYALDEANGALHEVWSFGVGDGVSSESNGEAHRLPNGNTLHNIGSGGVIHEVTPDGAVVWELDWGYGHLLGRSLFLDDLWAFSP
jgi:hypothetical protein